MEKNEITVSNYKAIDEDGFQALSSGMNPLSMAEDERFIADLTSERRVQYCSMKPSNAAEEIVLFNAMNSSDKRLADCINETLALRHIFVEVVNCINKETGDSKYCPRIVFIDQDGVSYQCVSLGIFSGVKKLLSVKGDPNSWNAPVYVKVLQITKDTKKLLSLKMVAPPIESKKNTNK